MRKYFTIKNVALLAMFIALCLIGYWYYNMKDTLHDMGVARNLDSMRFKTIVNSKGLEVAQAQAIILYQQDQINDYGDSVFHLTKKQSRKDRDYIALLRAKQKLELQFSAEYLEDDSADTTASVDADTTALCDSCIRVPKRFAYSDGNMNMYGTVRKDRVDIDSGSLSNTISFRLLEKKEGLFKKGVNVDAINSNKLIKFEGVQGLYVKYEPTFWNKWLKPAVAFLAGVVAVKLITK